MVDSALAVGVKVAEHNRQLVLSQLGAQLRESGAKLWKIKRSAPVAGPKVRQRGETVCCVIRVSSRRVS